MSKILELPLPIRVLVILGVPVIIIVIIMMLNSDNAKKPEFGNGPTASPTAPSNPAPSPSKTEDSRDPEIVKQEEFADQEEKKASVERKYNEENIASAPPEELMQGQEFAIEALENYYAFSLNESVDDRQKRLSKFFLPQSEYIISTPDGALDLTQEVSNDPSNRVDIGGAVEIIEHLDYQDGTITELGFMRVKTRTNMLASDENRAWMFTNDIEVQVTVKKINGEWKVLSILNQGEVAR